MKALVFMNEIDRLALPPDDASKLVRNSGFPTRGMPSGNVTLLFTDIEVRPGEGRSGPIRCERRPGGSGLAMALCTRCLPSTIRPALPSTLRRSTCHRTGGSSSAAARGRLRVTRPGAEIILGHLAWVPLSYGGRPRPL